MAEQGGLDGRRDEQFMYDLDDNVAVVLHDPRLVHQLSQPSTLGNDWKGLAGLLNYSAQQVQQFEQATTTTSSSCMAFLRHWQTKRGSTVRAFRKHLLKLGMHDVVKTLDSVLRNEFDLVGVLWQAGGTDEEITAPVHGKITLREAFKEELSKRGLETDTLELLYPKGNDVAPYHWDSLAHQLKGQQVTFRKKKLVSYTIADNISRKPTQRLPTEPAIQGHLPVQCQGTTMTTQQISTKEVSLHLSNLYTNSLLPPSSQGDGRNHSIPLLEQLHQQELDRHWEVDHCRELDHRWEVDHHRDVDHHREMSGEDLYIQLLPDEVAPDNVYESLYSEGVSARPPRVKENGLSQHAVRDLPPPPAIHLMYENHGVRRAGEEPSAEDSPPHFPPEWELLPGWHDLGAKGAKKKQIQHLMQPYMNEDGHYILTRYPNTDDILISVTFKGTTKSFLVKRTENNNNGRHKNKYYLFSDKFQAPSISELLEYYKQHKLSDEIRVRLKHPVT